ncbi:MAG: hypothetical protein KGQ46_13795 [Hyphomicrobiales bacterium]|nr:hypothetical protein [Hyphomicrobiales bacterium]MDE2115063.1 hypothetical protein [Hyphomicrobiales bacterium]
MADYYSQTVIQQNIPISDMTVLERLVLEAMFQSDVENHALYFYHDEGPHEVIYLDRKELVAANDPKIDTGTLGTLILDAINEAAPDSADIEVDLTAISWEVILQPIIARSSTLTYLTIVTSWTCSKMRPDGFGGMATLVTADIIESQSTYEIVEQWIGEMEDTTKPAPQGMSAALDQGASP